MNIKKYINNRISDYKKIIQYQNINDFSRPTLKLVGINPTHKVLLIGRKKRKKGSHKIDVNSNYESIALILKQYLLFYVCSSIVSVVILACTRLYL